MGHCKFVILNLLVFITYWLVKNNIHTKCVTVVTFHLNIFENTQFGDELKYVCFMTYTVYRYHFTALKTNKSMNPLC